jgi:mRNA-degrading endonuclease RelE of RelBE toxin-antitoxin system
MLAAALHLRGQELSPRDIAARPGRSRTGHPDRRRLRVGQYRILYEITDDTIAIRHIARGTAN